MPDASSLFWFPRDLVATPSAPAAPTEEGLRGWFGGGEPVTVSNGGTLDLSRQFTVFQLNPERTGPTILDAGQVEPSIPGSADQPDVLARIEMLSFHLGTSEAVEPGTRATMRINLGKDESSTDKAFETVFWSVAAGLSLYDQGTRKPAQGKQLAGDIPRAFGNRPVELPGGLARLSFEVIRHTDPPWWKRVFGFLQSGTAEKLVSVLGFPAITLQAIDLLDEFFNRIVDAEPEPLFKSVPMRLALSTYARDEFTAASARVRVGCLRPGICILARAADYGRIADANLGYDATVGRLIPLDGSPGAAQAHDPLPDATYAVFRVGLRATRLDPTFSFR